MPTRADAQPRRLHDRARLHAPRRQARHAQRRLHEELRAARCGCRPRCRTTRATRTAISPSRRGRSARSMARTRSPPRRRSPPGKATPSSLAKQAACTACHGVTRQASVGPGVSRHRGALRRRCRSAEARLAAKVRQGGAGRLGRVPMPPQPQLKEADARALVQWILGGAR